MTRLSARHSRKNTPPSGLPISRTVTLSLIHILIPDLKLSQQPEKPLGKYGRMRKTYLKEHRPILYNQMLLSEKLYPHLLEIDETAQNRLEPVSYTHLDVYKRQVIPTGAGMALTAAWNGVPALYPGAITRQEKVSRALQAVSGRVFRLSLIHI